MFLLAALGMLGYSLAAFPTSLRDTGFALAVVTLVNDLLLVMIIMEVLRTVLSYLQERATSFQPFLFIAAISATRRILAIGAQMSVTGDTLSPDKFRQVMIDLGANAGASWRSPSRFTCSHAALLTSENSRCRHALNDFWHRRVCVRFAWLPTIRWPGLLLVRSKTRGRSNGAFYAPNSSGSALASLRSAVSKPSVNQP